MDRFDLYAALYVFCANHHSGQWSRGYRIMSRISRLRLHLSDNAWYAIQEGNSEEWENAHEIYKTLCAKYAEAM